MRPPQAPRSQSQSLNSIQPARGDRTRHPAWGHQAPAFPVCLSDGTSEGAREWFFLLSGQPLLSSHTCKVAFERCKVPGSQRAFSVGMVSGSAPHDSV